MVKTKNIAKLKGLAALKRPSMADVHTQVKPFKKGEYRTRDEPYGEMGEDEPSNHKSTGDNSWWHSMQDGETCRTTDDKKVHTAISMSINEGKGINIQGFQEHSVFAWYMTRILTKTDTQKPSEKSPAEKKGKRK